MGRFALHSKDKIASHDTNVKRFSYPNEAERVCPGWKVIGYRDPEVGYLCGLFPRADHVRLLFEHGARIPDPEGLFGGGGQTRFVVVRSPAAVPADGIRDLLRAALHEAALRRACR